MATTELRTDAARNRELAIAAAAEVFAARGIGASMSEIAAAAGLGVGTLYRGFGSKQGLIEAIFRDSVEHFRAFLDEALAKPSGRDGLHWLLRQYVEAQLANRGAFEILGSVDAAIEVLHEHVVPRLGEIVARAKAEGAVRDDFAATDIPVLTATIARAAAGPHGPDLARRHLELLIAGLAPRIDEVPVPPPLPDADFEAWASALRP